MAKQKVSLYIDDTGIRLLVTHAQRIKEWANLPLEPGLVKNNVITNETEVSARIRQLFNIHKIKTKRVIVGTSGLHCLSRPILLPQLPDDMINEVVPREAKRLLPVPSESLYLSWNKIPAPEGKTQVFLMAVPRNTVDALSRTLRRAGLLPYFLGVKPLFLTELTKGRPGIIVDVQNSEFDVVVVSDGIPQPVRTISFADEELSWPQKLPIIVNDTERTIAFFNTNNPGKGLAPDVPIFVSGELTNHQELCQTLSQKTSHPVIPLSSPLQHPDNFVPSQYIANIALALHKIPSGKKSVSSEINLNALPAIYQPKDISLTRVLALPAAVVLAGLLIAAFILIQIASKDVTSMKNELRTAEQILQQKTLQKQELTGNISQLEKQLGTVNSAISQFTVAVGSLEKKTTGLNSDLKVTMNTLPATVVLKSITHDSTLITVVGRTPDEKQLLAYVGNLSDSRIFADVTVSSVLRNKDNTLDFTLLGSHEGHNIAASSFLTAIKNISPDVTLLQVSYSKGSMTIMANTSVQDSILSYIKRLEETGRFLDVSITNMTRTDSGKVEFVLILKTGE